MTLMSDAEGTINIDQEILDNMQNETIHMLKVISHQNQYGINLLKLTPNCRDNYFDGSGHDAFEQTLPHLFDLDFYQNPHIRDMIRKFKTEYKKRFPNDREHDIFIFDFIDDNYSLQSLYHQIGTITYNQLTEDFTYKISVNKTYDYTLKHKVALFPDTYDQDKLYDINDIDDLKTFLDPMPDLLSDFNNLTPEDQEYIYEEIRDDEFYQGQLYQDENAQDFLDNLIQTYAQDED